MYGLETGLVVNLCRISLISLSFSKIVGHSLAWFERVFSIRTYLMNGV